MKCSCCMNWSWFMKFGLREKWATRLLAWITIIIIFISKFFFSSLIDNGRLILIHNFCNFCPIWMIFFSMGRETWEKFFGVKILLSAEVLLWKVEVFLQIWSPDARARCCFAVAFFYLSIVEFKFKKFELKLIFQKF